MTGTRSKLLSIGHDALCSIAAPISSAAAVWRLPNAAALGLSRLACVTPFTYAAAAWLTSSLRAFSASRRSPPGENGSTVTSAQGNSASCPPPAGAKRQAVTMVPKCACSAAANASTADTSGATRGGAKKGASHSLSSGVMPWRGHDDARAAVPTCMRAAICGPD